MRPVVTARDRTPGTGLTPSERALSGRRAREQVRRTTLGEWSPATDRADPVALLLQQETNRAPDLVPVRHERMSASAFAFYRGAAIIMAADLASVPSTGLRVQLSGDAHLANFGVYASPERNLVFDINDFDETLPGPFEWDLKRLAASFEIASRANGFDARDGDAVVTALVTTYCSTMAEMAAKGNLDIWYTRLTVDDLVQSVERRRVQELPEAVHPHGPQGREQGPSPRPGQAHHPGRRRTALREPAPAPRAHERARQRYRLCRAVRPHPRRSPPVPPHAPSAPAGTLRPVPAGRRRQEGRRRGERGHPLLGRALRRPRRRGSAVPPGQGGGGFSVGAAPRTEQVHAARPARGRGPAADAGCQ